MVPRGIMHPDEPPGRGASDIAPPDDAISGRLLTRGKQNLGTARPASIQRTDARFFPRSGSERLCWDGRHSARQAKWWGRPSAAGRQGGADRRAYLWGMAAAGGGAAWGSKLAWRFLRSGSDREPCRARPVLHPTQPDPRGDLNFIRTCSPSRRRFRRPVDGLLPSRGSRGTGPARPSGAGSSCAPMRPSRPGAGQKPPPRPGARADAQA